MAQNDEHCCNYSRMQEEEQQERSRTRKIYKAVQDGEMSKSTLYSHGQDKIVQGNLLLAEDEPDHIIAVVKDDWREDRVAGSVGTSKKIVKGKCHHCGSNRVVSQHKEPGGIGGLSCPVCGNDQFTTDQPAEIEEFAKASEDDR